MEDNEKVRIWENVVGKEWVKALENIDKDTNRLPRGRSHAKNSHVVSINISDKSVVKARVKGTRPQPYREEIKLKPFGKELNVLEDIIFQNPDLAAQLLAGLLPEKLNDALIKRGVYLFPRSWNEIDALLLMS